VVQQILLAAGEHGLHLIGRRCDTLDHDEDLARRHRRRLGPRHDAIAAVDAEVEFVVVLDGAGEHFAYVLFDRGGDVVDGGDEIGVSRAREHDAAFADRHRAFDLYRRSVRRFPARAADADAPCVDRLVFDCVEMQRPFRLLHAVRVGLLVQRVRGDGHRCGAAVRVHAFNHGGLALQRAQHGVASARGAAERGTFDDLRHVHGGAEREAQPFRDGGEDRGIAGAAGEDDVRPEIERAPEGLRPHLADKMRRIFNVAIVGHGHLADRGKPSFRPCGSNRVLRDVGADHRELEAQPFGARDAAQKRERGVEMRPRAGAARGADQQRHVERARPTQHEAEVAPRHRFGRGDLSGAQIAGAGVDGSHVAADEVRLARQARLQRRLRNAVAELARGRQRPQRARARAAGEFLAQPRAGAHRSIPSSGPCCCVPYTSRSPGLPATTLRSSTSLMASACG